MMHLTYRKGTIQDKNQLKELALASYGEYAEVLTPENWATLEGNLNSDDRLDDVISRAHIFVCAAHDKIIGVAYLIPSGNPTDIYKSEWCHIRMVGVHPSHRGHGIARKLMQMCIGHALLTNEQTIALHTSEFMHAARHIYESMGFTALKEIEPIFGKRYWLYTLDMRSLQ